jgi:SAM-dependent methyltransferase
MDERVANTLIRINKEFYQTFSASFAHTRQRVQPGVSQVLDQIPREGNWLDLGCGNGSLAREWVQQGRRGLYHGVDSSPQLLQIARQNFENEKSHPGLEMIFSLLDLTSPQWSSAFKEMIWDGVLAFAVLHHIPGQAIRSVLISRVRDLLSVGKPFWISVWQFQHSPRFRSRQIGWEAIHLSEKEVEPGDTLIDWRAETTGEQKKIGIRYVHFFKDDELNSLAQQNGFRVMNEFPSDGKGGNLSLYQLWQAI